MTLYARWVDEKGETVYPEGVVPEDDSEENTESTDGEEKNEPEEGKEAVADENKESTAENPDMDADASGAEDEFTAETENDDEFIQNAALDTIVLKIGNTRASVFGRVLENDVPPIIKNNRTMLPVRFISEAFGAVVGWDGETRTVTVTSDNVEISFVIGNDYAMVNGEEVMLDCPAMIERNRTYLPIRFIAEKIGATVEWDEETKVITIKR